MPDELETGSLISTMEKSVKNPAVRLRGVRKEYRLYDSLSNQAIDVLGLSWLRFWRPVRYRTFVALEGIDLNIGHGELVGIVGRNGAGKTTMLKLITGNFAPTAGEIEISGDVQALMQTGLGFHGEFSGIDNAKASLIYNGLSGDELDAAEEDIIEFCELGDFLYQPVKTYSLGMRTRLQFAAATAIKPDILIVDEVLGAGDAYFNAKSSERMDRLTKSGCTMLLVSHSMQQIMQFCNRCVWIDNGKVQMDGEVRDVVGAYEVMIANDIKERAISKINYDKKRLSLQKRIIEANSQGNELDCFQQELESGLPVFRWQSNDGVKIVDLKVLDQNGEETVFQSGGSLEIELVMECEISGKLTVCTHVAIFDEASVRVAWITSPADRFDAEPGERRIISVKIDELLLGEGNYTISLSVFDGTNPHLINVGSRFDLLARCYDFSVVAQDPRPKPVFYHPSRWSFEQIKKNHEHGEKREKRGG